MSIFKAVAGFAIAGAVSGGVALSAAPASDAATVPSPIVKCGIGTPGAGHVTSFACWHVHPGPVAKKSTGPVAQKPLAVKHYAIR